jgi:hypothetical protein
MNLTEEDKAVGTKKSNATKRQADVYIYCLLKHKDCVHASLIYFAI